MLNQSRADLVTLVSEIAMRYCTRPDRVDSLLKFALVSKLSINYRALLHSSAGCNKLWDYIDIQTNVLDSNFMDIILSMTSEFMFLGNMDDAVVANEAAGSLAKTLCWPKNARGIPDELSELTADLMDYQVTLRDNPWVMFVYLAGMTDLVRILSTVRSQG